MEFASHDFVDIHEVQDIAARIIELNRLFGSDQRLLVGIAGRPGSGKTFFANTIAKAILDGTKNINVVVMPMDGYHLYRHELSSMPNPELAFARRGSHWTFNPEKLYVDLVRISEGIDDVKVPSFDHSLKDPKENDITIPKNVQIVIVEGNYLLYTEDPKWSEVSKLFHLKVFLQCDPIECTERLAVRHMAAWGISREEAMLRAKGSDSKNGDLIDTTKGNADVVCNSLTVLVNCMNEANLPSQ